MRKMRYMRKNKHSAKEAYKCFLIRKNIASYVLRVIYLHLKHIFLFELVVYVLESRKFEKDMYLWLSHFPFFFYVGIGM